MFAHFPLFGSTVRRPLSAQCICTQIALNSHRTNGKLSASPRPLFCASSFAISNGLPTNKYTAADKLTHTSLPTFIHFDSLSFGAFVVVVAFFPQLYFLSFLATETEIIWVSANKYLCLFTCTESLIGGYREPLLSMTKRSQVSRV